MGPASPVIEEMHAVVQPNASPTATPQIHVWTFARVVPIVVSVIIPLSVVALRPNITGSLIAVAVQICLMGLLVKTWLLR